MPCGKKAAELLFFTFKKIHDNNISEEKFHAYCITLIHLIITTANELYPLKFKNIFKLKYFEKTPVLKQLMCNQVNFNDYCNEKYLNKEAALQVIRKGVRLLSDFKNEPVFLNRNTIKTQTLNL